MGENMNKKTIFLFLFLIISFGRVGFYLIPQGETTFKFKEKDNLTSMQTAQNTLDNITVISDDSSLWNNEDSKYSSIAIDSSNSIHVVWQDETIGLWGDDTEIMYCKYTSSTGWSNATVISDDSSGWNNEDSKFPSIAVDSSDNLHIVWYDNTNGIWGNDYEIMYCNYTSGTGWSNATIISDDSSGWNDGNSYSPEIAIDNLDNLHVVWRDETDGIWGDDIEIMYCNYTSATGWSNATVISDDSSGWNNEDSQFPSITIDSLNNIHVVWNDYTDGWWGTDAEIMYCNYTSAIGWSNATVISDDLSNWNNKGSNSPSIAIDTGDNLHVVWHDETIGLWGDDIEIMYCNYTSTTGWLNATVISDDSSNWNNDWSSVSTIVVDSMDNLHVVWHDNTDGWWGNDTEIMYCKYTSSNGWSNATIISDDLSNWNNGNSLRPAIDIDSSDNIHFVWHDHTNGTWGIDTEIMYKELSLEEDVPDGGGGGIPGFPLTCFTSIAILSMLGVIILTSKKSFLN